MLGGREGGEREKEGEGEREREREREKKMRKREWEREREREGTVILLKQDFNNCLHCIFTEYRIHHEYLVYKIFHVIIFRIK